MQSNQMLLEGRFPCLSGNGRYPKSPGSRFTPGGDRTLDALLDVAIANGDLEAISVKRAAHDWSQPHAEVWRICSAWHAKRQGGPIEPDDDPAHAAD
jgi:hypothetical protein